MTKLRYSEENSNYEMSIVDFALQVNREFCFAGES